MLIPVSSKTMQRIAKVVKASEAAPLEKRGRRRPRAVGAGRPMQAQPIWVRRASGEPGGVPGDAENPCTFAYDGWFLTADTSDPEQRLFVAEQPLAPRTAVGKYDESPEDCPGWAVLVKLEEDDFPTWHLWYAPGERWNVPGPCQPCLPGGMGSVGIMAV